MSKIKQKADELVEVFGTAELMLTTNSRGRLTSPYKSGFLAMKAKEYEGLKCAILHQKRLIEILDKHRRLDKSISIKLEILEQEAILTELESRL